LIPRGLEPDESPVDNKGKDPHALRLQFHSSRLKERDVEEQFKKRVEALSQEEKPDMDLLLSKLEDKSLPIVEFADAANHIIVTILHKAGEEILSIGSTETENPLKKSTLVGHHSSTDPAEANCQRRIQALRNQLEEAQASTPQTTLEDIAAQLRRERQNLHGLRTEKRNHKFLHATGAAQPQDQDPKTLNRSMWDYLKRYKNDHVQSSLPKEDNENASRDPRIWKLGPLSPNPLAWHQYCFALSHPLQGHKESPYDETEARLIDTLNIRNLPVTAPINPLFVDPFHLKEIQDAMRALNKDKSPGPDGITNIMLTGGGEIVTGLLHDFLSSLWLHEIQPIAWELSLMQPIYKGRNKLKTDPASYRDIYLSSALAKLFEGLLLR
jgi:hypothetical protein